MNNDVQISQGALVIVGTIVASLIGAISLLFKTLMGAKDDQNKQMLATMTAQNERLLKDKEQIYEDLKKERDALRAMTLTAIADLELAANLKRKNEGLTPLEKITPITPQHNSEPTTEQIIAAEIATLRIRLTSATLALGLPIRTLASILPDNLSSDVEKLIAKVNSDLDLLTTRPLGYIVIDKDGKVITFSGHLLLMLDWHDTDLIGKDITTIIPSRFHEKHLEELNKAKNPRLPYVNRVLRKLPMLTKNGSEILVNLYLLRWFTDDGEIRFGAYIHEYETDQPKTNEENIRLAEKDINSILENE